MEPWELELIERHKNDDNELRTCVEEHQRLEREIDELNKRVYLTAEEEYERKELQKRKLAGRDKMDKILNRYRKENAQQG